MAVDERCVSSHEMLSNVNLADDEDQLLYSLIPLHHEVHPRKKESCSRCRTR